MGAYNGAGGFAAVGHDLVRDYRMGSGARRAVGSQMAVISDMTPTLTMRVLGCIWVVACRDAQNGFPQDVEVVSMGVVVVGGEVEPYTFAEVIEGKGMWWENLLCKLQTRSQMAHKERC